MNLGAPEIVLIILAVLLLFGYKRLPDASRSFGRSLRIFKGEMKGMKDDDAPAPAAGGSAARGEIMPPSAAPGPVTPAAPAVDLEAEARAAEVRAAQLRARADQAGAAQAVGQVGVGGVAASPAGSSAADVTR